MKKNSTFILAFFLIMVLAIFTSCSSKKQSKTPGRCKQNCETKWEQANRTCKPKRGIDKELCLKHTYWELNDWM